MKTTVVITSIILFFLSGCQKEIEAYQINNSTVTSLKITTLPVSQINDSSANSGGEIIEILGLEIKEKGVCWSTTQNPTINSAFKTSDGSGKDSYVSRMRGLIKNNNYYLRAYVLTNKGVYYGNELSFKISGRTFIPDRNFEQHLINLKLDDKIDQYVLTSNIENLQSLNVSSMGINDLTGIEDFKKLTLLNCSSNNLTSLDVTNNLLLTRLECSHNKLSSLDVTKNTELLIFDFWNNFVSSIDVTKNVKLEILSIGVNKISEIDISKNIALIEIDFQNSDTTRGGLVKIDVSNNINLKRIYLYHNKLEQIDVSKNTQLTDLWIYDNKLTGIDVSNNALLTHLICYNNQIRDIDVSKNKNLLNFRISNNKLTILDVSNNLKLQAFSCDYNNISTLDVTNNSKLTLLECNNNNISTLDVSKSTDLIYFFSQNNKLTSVNLKNGSNSKIKEVDLRNNPGLACIQVDDPLSSEKYALWFKDFGATYKTNC